MALIHYSETNEIQKFKWTSNYSFGALTEKYLWETKKKKVTSAKDFLEWCAENGYVTKEPI